MILTDPEMTPLEKYYYEKEWKQGLDSYERRLKILKEQLSKE